MVHLQQICNTGYCTRGILMSRSTLKKMLNAASNSTCLNRNSWLAVMISLQLIDCITGVVVTASGGACRPSGLMSDGSDFLQHLLRLQLLKRQQRQTQLVLLQEGGRDGSRFFFHFRELRCIKAFHFFVSRDTLAVFAHKNVNFRYKNKFCSLHFII